jgi:aspartate aminotransferase
MDHQISDRVLSIEESKSVALASVVNRLRSEGKTIIGLNVGEPELPTPKVVIEATKKALDEGQTRYSLVPGIVTLREKIAERSQKKLHFDVKPENVIVGSGSKNVIFSVLQAIINPGDEVIIPLPYWVTFPESVKLAGGVPRSVLPGKDFSLDIDAIRKVCSQKTKAIIINSPNNPSGAIFSREQLKQIADLAKEFNFYIIADEAYEAILYPEASFTHIACLDEETRKRTLTIQSFSKSYLMTGFRVGYLVASEEVVKMVNRFNSHMLGNISVYSQVGALTALENEDQILNDLLPEMKKRRDLAYKLFSEIFDVQNPEGAFYLFADVSKFLEKSGEDDIQFAARILEETQVAVLPGSAFGLKDHIRICFAVPTEQIQLAYDRLKGMKL